MFFRLFFGGMTLKIMPSENGSILSTNSSSALPPKVIICISKSDHLLPTCVALEIDRRHFVDGKTWFGVCRRGSDYDSDCIWDKGGRTGSGRNSSIFSSPSWMSAAPVSLPDFPLSQSSLALPFPFLVEMLFRPFSFITASSAYPSLSRTKPAKYLQALWVPSAWTWGRKLGSENVQIWTYSPKNYGS